MDNPIQILLQIDLSTSPAGSAWDGGNTVAILLLVILAGGLAAALFLFKRFGYIRKPGNGNLEIIETRPLGGRQFLVVGRYGAETFLLGVCPGRIEYLTRLDRAEDASFSEMLDTQRGVGREGMEQ